MTLVAINALSHAASGLDAAVGWLRLALEAGGAIVIAIGAGRVVMSFAWGSRGDNPFNASRLLFARHLSLALEFQLASDILGTAVSPTWYDIGELAAIAAIRTALNYFLTREIRDERSVEREREARADLH